MSTLAVNNIQPANAGSESYFLSKAWVNFNGTGTVAIRQDGNVSSVTDLGVGSYAVIFSTAMVDANHAAGHTFTNEVNVQHGVGYITTPLTASLTISFYSAANSAATMDKGTVGIIVVR
jgi:hypothetical protein